MRKNELTQKRLKEVLKYDPETGIFTWLQSLGGKMIYTRAGTISNGSRYDPPRPSFRFIRIDKDPYQEHFLALYYMTGRMPKAVIHKNGNHCDNRWENLEKCTISQTRANKVVCKDSKSGFKGVSKSRDKWRADCCREFLGRFDTPEEASAAYQEAAKRKYGSALR